MPNLSVLLSLFTGLTIVQGHGFLKRPAQRSYVWREGLNPSLNKYYNHMALNCGTAGRQYNKNGGKCGTCGDPYDEAQPRAHELGGTFGSGYISPNAVYTQGQVIPTVVDITANHKGWFEFRVCKVTDNNPVTQNCLDQNLLKLDNGDTRYDLAGNIRGDIPIGVKLPEDLSCDHCVLQWYWLTGNSHRNKETFINCADITIQPTSNQPPSPTTTTTKTTTTTAVPVTSNLPTTTLPPIMTCYPGQSNVCRWIGPNNGLFTKDQMDGFCVNASEAVDPYLQMNCRCSCDWPTVPGDCSGISNTWDIIPNPDPFCAATCGQCPTAHCRC
ncbi:uncharacterized protein LOC132562118 [Ylistrum balloti]|uniref:uncharacterized protein LOC132562118 n=1 Tax=Ylistrum balloti TaxID=509963 RepID=UPI002905CEEF|nr:uncharacterized protein LOC132562118 [Ylistrum balloti]